MSTDQAGDVPATSGTPLPPTAAPISPRFFEALVQHGQDAIALISATGRVLYASPASMRILGHSAEQIVVQPSVLDHLHPDDRARAEATFATLLTQPGTFTRGTARCRHKDGAWRWLEFTATNLLEDPEIRAIVANYRDVTERVEQEAERVRQAKLEGALLVARTAAHELLNALQPISGFAELLANEPAVRTDARLATFAKHIVAGTLDAAQRVQHLRQLVRVVEDTTTLGPEFPLLDLDRSTSRE